MAQAATTTYCSVSLVAALGLLAGTHLHSASANQSPSSLADRVEAIVQAELLTQGVPSASVAVLRDGKMLVQRAWGLADVDKGVKANASTTYPIASNTKQFTAALVLKLVDRGRLSLIDPLGKHLPGLRPEFEPITIEQLLSHTSGLPNDFRDPERRLETLSPNELFAMAARRPLETKPGTTFQYSNTGYMLLAVLVEKLYGKPYGAVLQDEIATPLGLSLARCTDPKPGEAVGYRRMPDGKIVPPPGLHHSQQLGVGGLCATAGDLVTWTQALHSGRVLSAASHTAMTTPRGAAVSGNYGLGLYVRPAPWGAMAMVHGGQSQTGHTSELQWYPEQRLAVALLYNVAPRVPGVSDLIPRAVLGVPPPAKPKGPER